MLALEDLQISSRQNQFDDRSVWPPVGSRIHLIDRLSETSSFLPLRLPSIELAGQSVKTDVKFGSGVKEVRH